jgi:hypothetical protein
MTGLHDAGQSTCRVGAPCQSQAIARNISVANSYLCQLGFWVLGGKSDFGGLGGCLEVWHTLHKSAGAENLSFLTSVVRSKWGGKAKIQTSGRQAEDCAVAF